MSIGLWIVLGIAVTLYSIGVYQYLKLVKAKTNRKCKAKHNKHKDNMSSSERRALTQAMVNSAAATNIIMFPPMMG